MSTTSRPDEQLAFPRLATDDEPPPAPPRPDDGLPTGVVHIGDVIDVALARIFVRCERARRKVS